MSSRYAPLPNPSFSHDDRELEDAFGSDDENENQRLQYRSQPIDRCANATIAEEGRIAVTPGYDFEREYDYPPPGSPTYTGVSPSAIPNTIGNSNGLLPSSPVASTLPRVSFFRRAVGSILPTHYSRLANSSSSSDRPRGGGIENDGVFFNVMAKPGTAVVSASGSHNLYMSPEESQDYGPPSYVDAQQDAVPPYWETVVHAPAAPDSSSQLVIDDLPIGTILIFIANIFISFFFQIVGFMLTYMLLTSHAAKYGSRAGLGLTLIHYGFYSRVGGNESVPDGSDSNPSSSPTDISPSDDVGQSKEWISFSPMMRDWISFVLMTAGWLLFLSSVVGFLRVKRWEASLRASTPEPVSQQDIERDIAQRHHLHELFGIGEEEMRPSPEPSSATPPTITSRPASDLPRSTTFLIPDQTALEEARLERALRSAGLL